MGCGEEGGWSPFVLTTLSCLVYISPFFPSPTVLILDSEQYSTSDIPLIEYIITTHTDMLRSHPYKYLSPIFYKHQSLSPKNVLWKHCFFFFFCTIFATYVFSTLPSFTAVVVWANLIFSYMYITAAVITPWVESDLLLFGNIFVRLKYYLYICLC